MTDDKLVMSTFTSVEQRAPEPFGFLRIDVVPMSFFGVGHSVGVTDERAGRGTRTSLERAEAEAKAVLKAIRTYRRKNAAILSPDGNTEGNATDE